MPDAPPHSAPPGANPLCNDYGRLSGTARSFLFRAPHGMLIGGRWSDAGDGGTSEVIDPSSGRSFTRVAEASAGDVDRAVAAARAAIGGPWGAMRPLERERLMHRLADLIEANARELAEIESVDNGKPVGSAHDVDIGLSLELLRYTAGWASKITGDTLQPSVTLMPDSRFFAYTLRQPVGVVAAILPWNFPFLEAMLKLAPALASGCTIVLKPSEETPLSTLRLGELVIEAGFPDGVVNIVSGRGAVAGAALVAHADVDMVSFTGSTASGRAVGAACAAQTRRLMLELGGKSPVIVFPDADLDVAISGASEAIFFNSGQDCTAGSRLLVHREVLDRVVEGVTALGKAKRIGPGLDPASEVGPLVSQRQLDRICRYIDLGRAQGATLALGGARVGDAGYYVEPTIFVGAPTGAAIVQEEIFGPVLSVGTFETLDEAVALANGTSYGLAASVWSQNVTTVNRIVPRLMAGTVWVNCHGALDPAVPIGGFKGSGFGREMGAAVLAHYTETKAVYVAH